MLGHSEHFKKTILLRLRPKPFALHAKYGPQHTIFMVVASISRNSKAAKRSLEENLLDAAEDFRLGLRLTFQLDSNHQCTISAMEGFRLDDFLVV